MDDIAQWLRAQLDEEAALVVSGESWTAFDESWQGTRRVDVDHSVERVVAVTKSWRGDHIARHDPARVLREIEAKRRIVDASALYCSAGCCTEHSFAESCNLRWMGPAWEADGKDWVRDENGTQVSAPPVTPTHVLRLLAQPYSDRPGYREEWKE